MICEWAFSLRLHRCFTHLPTRIAGVPFVFAFLYAVVYKKEILPRGNSWSRKLLIILLMKFDKFFRVFFCADCRIFHWSAVAFRFSWKRWTRHHRYERLGSCFDQSGGFLSVVMQRVFKSRKYNILFIQGASSPDQETIFVQSLICFHFWQCHPWVDPQVNISLKQPIWVHTSALNSYFWSWNNNCFYLSLYSHTDK